VAYVVVMPEQTPGSDELRAHLAAALPEYMLPAAFVAVAAFPLTPNGKIDRKALPAPNADALPSGEPFVAPRDGTEHDLAAIWADVMGIERISARDNFFHLGGHSLMAIRLFTRIREQMGVELPFGLLLQHPTVAALADAIDERRRPTPAAGLTKSAIVPLRASGSRLPIFFTHGIGGEVWSFVALTRHLGDDQPVYGLQPVHDAEGATPTVADVAARYVDEIRTVQPHGPYMLAGHCAGAAIALEMARQIRARGEQVGVVAAIDYWLGGTVDRRWHVRAIDFLRNLPHWIRDDLTRVSPATIVGRLRSAGRIASVRWRGLFRRGPAGQAADTGVDIRDRLGMWRFPDYQVAALERAFRMFQAYEPEPFEGDMLVVRARTLPLFPFRVAPDMGWSRVVRGRIEVRDVKGSHETILQEPLVGGVAAVLRDAMDRVPGAGAPVTAPESAPNRPAQPALR
jgi:thioesterase domain-containing protein/acyl carrier protein